MRISPPLRRIQCPSNPQVNPPVNPYQQDPFEGAQVTRGRDTRRQQGAGFRKKYQQDPYAQFQDETAGTDYQQPVYITDEDWKATGDYAQYFQQDDNEPPGGTTPPPTDYNALQNFNETGLTPENVSAVYSLKESELPQYGIDIHAPNIGDAPEGVVSGWNDEDGDGFDDDGHAYGTHGAVNVQTAAGEQSIQSVLDEAGQEQPWYSKLYDKGTAYLQDWAAPDVEATPYAPDGFMTSPGGAVGAALPGPIGAFAAIGGAISKANLDKIYAEHGEYNADTGLGVMPVGSVDGVTTPLAVSPGFYSWDYCGLRQY